MPGHIDADLLARAVAGDGAAFTSLVEPHQRAVFRHCYRMLGSGADAEDATQDTLERAALLLHDVLAFTHVEVGEVLGTGPTAVNSLLSRARESVRATTGRPQPGRGEPAVRQLLDRYVRAWQLADIEGFVRLVADDVRFSMPPLTA